MPRTLRCKVITLLHSAHVAANWTPTASNGFHLPLYQRHYTMEFIYDIRHAAAAENIAVYIIVIYWTSWHCRLLTKCTAWALVHEAGNEIETNVPRLACVLHREAINYFAIRISWWPIRIRISNLKFLINYN